MLRHLVVDPVFRFFLNRFLGVVAAYPSGSFDRDVVMVANVFRVIYRLNYKW